VRQNCANAPPVFATIFVATCQARFCVFSGDMSSLASKVSLHFERYLVGASHRQHVSMLAKPLRVSLIRLNLVVESTAPLHVYAASLIQIKEWQGYLLLGFSLNDSRRHKSIRHQLAPWIESKIGDSRAV
jgi:hypothetical protein